MPAKPTSKRIAKEIETEYLYRLPDVVPTGWMLVHNHVVPPTRRLGSRGFRAWLSRPDAGLKVCRCGWAPELGRHFIVRAAWSGSR